MSFCIFHPDGKHLVTSTTPYGEKHWTFRVWDLETGRNRLTPVEPVTEWPTSFQLSGDGKRLALWTGRMTQVVDLDSGAVLLRTEPHEAAKQGIWAGYTRLSHDGRWAYTTQIWGDTQAGGYQHGRLRIEDLEGQTPAKVVDLGYAVFSPFIDAASGQPADVRVLPDQHLEVEYRDATSGKIVSRVPIHGDRMNVCLAVAPIGGHAIAWEQGKRFRALDLPSGKEIYILDREGENNLVWLSDDGRACAIVIGKETRLYRLPNPVPAKDKP